jgi:hypothetical protein
MTSEGGYSNSSYMQKHYSGGSMLAIKISLSNIRFVFPCFTQQGHLTPHSWCGSIIEVHLIKGYNLGHQHKDIFPTSFSYPGIDSIAAGDMLPRRHHFSPYFSGKFLPSVYIRTESVVTIDSGVMVSTRDLEFAFSIWLTHSDYLVGSDKMQFEGSLNHRFGLISDDMPDVYDNEGNIDIRYLPLLFTRTNNKGYGRADTKLQQDLSFAMLKSTLLFFKTDYLYTFSCITPLLAYLVHIRLYLPRPVMGRRSKVSV